MDREELLHTQRADYKLYPDFWLCGFSAPKPVFSKTLKIELPFNPAIPLLGLYLETSSNSKRYMYPNIHSSTIYNNQDMEAAQVPIQEMNRQKKM